MSPIRKIYLYLFSFIGLVLIVIACVQLVNLALTVYVFPAVSEYHAYPSSLVAEKDASSTAPTNEQIVEYERAEAKSEHERTAADSLAMIIVGLPLYLYHWRVIRKDKDVA